MKTLADRKRKAPDQLTKIKEPYKNKAHMPPSKITDSTPGEVHQLNLFADLTEEEYLGFASMCGFGLNAY